jgi:hypothetical protein
MRIPRVWIFFGALFAACAGLIGAARAVSRLSPPAPVYLDTGPCDQPCWQGVQPGVTTLAELNSPATAAVIRRTPYLISRAATYGGETVLSFELNTRGTLTLGDMIRVWGPPEQVAYLGLDYSRMGTLTKPVLSVQLYFFGGLVVVQAFSRGEARRLSPDMRVYAITYYAPGEPAFPIGKTTGWHGLASVSRYRTIFEN